MTTKVAFGFDMRANRVAASVRSNNLLATKSGFSRMNSGRWPPKLG